MSDPETPEEETATEPVKVKQVVISASIVAAALAAAVAFTVAGPLGVGVAAAGVAGTGYAAHRVRNPRKGTLLHSWLTRTRRTTTKGSLTWPFTGSQSRRALSRSGGSSKRGAGISATRGGFRATRSSGSAFRKATSGKPIGGSRGRPLPKTTRSRAAAGAGGVLPKHKGSRPVPSRTKPVTRSASKPVGIRTPKTASKTPATLSKSRPLRGMSSGRSGSATRRGPLSLGRKSSGAGGTSARRSSLGTTPKGRNRTGSGSSKGLLARKLGSPTPGRSSTTNRRAGRGRFNPWLGTRGGQSLGRRSTDTRRTGRAKRLGGIGPTIRSGRSGVTPNGRSPFRRWSRDRNRNTAPNRTSLRPRPYARRTTGQLLRTSLRIPKRQRGTYGSRNGWRPFVRPNRTQAKRARRTLRLRSGVWLRRGAVWVAKTPARRWDRLWERLPKAPLPLTHYTERAGMKTPSGPKATTKPTATPVRPTTPAVARDINLIPIKQNGNVIYVSSPNDLIRDAFQQLASFHPGSATEVEAWAADLGDTLSDVGRSFGVLADQMRDGMPFAAPFADSVREIGVAIAATAGLAQSSHQTMRAAHEADFRRFEDPRPDEGMWNPERNR